MSEQKTLQSACNDVYHGNTSIERAIDDLVESGESLTIHWDINTAQFDVDWTVNGKLYTGSRPALRLALVEAMNNYFVDQMAELFPTQATQ